MFKMRVHVCVLLIALRRNRILDISTLEEDPGAAQEFAR